MRIGIGNDMGQTLISSHGISRTLGPITAAALATRIVSTAQVLTRTLPDGFTGQEPVSILLALFIAREEGRTALVADVAALSICSENSTARWLAALMQHGLACASGGLVALTDIGNDLVLNCLEEIYSVQRQLDPALNDAFAKKQYLR